MIYIGFLIPKNQFCVRRKLHGRYFFYLFIYLFFQIRVRRWRQFTSHLKCCCGIELWLMWGTNAVYSLQHRTTSRRVCGFLESSPLWFWSFCFAWFCSWLYCSTGLQLSSGFSFTEIMLCCFCSEVLKRYCNCSQVKGGCAASGESGNVKRSTYTSIHSVRK